MVNFESFEIHIIDFSFSHENAVETCPTLKKMSDKHPIILVSS